MHPARNAAQNLAPASPPPLAASPLPPPLSRRRQPEPPGQSPPRWLAVAGGGGFSPPRVRGLRERPGRAEAPGRVDPGGAAATILTAASPWRGCRWVDAELCGGCVRVSSWRRPSSAAGRHVRGIRRGVGTRPRWLLMRVHGEEAAACVLGEDGYPRPDPSAAWRRRSQWPVGGGGTSPVAAARFCLDPGAAALEGGCW